MKLQQIADELNKKFSFPYQLINKQVRFTDHVYISVSLEKKEDWAHGIHENSHYLKAFVFCKGDHELETDNTYNFEIVVNATGTKLMQKKNLTGEKMLEYVTKQLQKLQ